MIRSYTITIDEIDDAESASAQAAEQLASCALLKNTLGIVTAHPEFVSGGIYGRIVKALPFPTIGTTTISHCAPGAAGIFIMSVLILTSDDCDFSHSVSAPVLHECDAAETARVFYAAAREKLFGEPRLAFLYAPFLDKPHTGEYVAALTGINPRLPLFGAITNDDHRGGEDNSMARTLYCGEAFNDRYALALVCGPIDPKFYITSVTEEAVVMPDIGVVTAAYKNKLLEVNDINATEFFKSVGFLSQNVILNRDSGMLSSIFVFRVSGESGDINISRIPVRVESDGITCGGQIIEGAVISVAFNTNESVLATVSQLMKTVKEKHGSGTAIINSCLGRRFGLLNEPMKELETIRDILGSDFNYTAAYVNGEVCPIYVSGNAARNQDHNQTLVVCVF